MQTEESTEEMRILKIKKGTVIDHITAGHALEVVRLLGIPPGTDLKISLIMNASSKLMESGKDIIKIENRELTEAEASKITLIAPEATINIIRNFVRIEKYRVKLPNEIKDIITCPNGTCITNAPRECINSKFRVISKKPPILECVYCDAQIEGKEIYNFIKR